jgi:ectoine hydroxylase-related dioxygenase (phytanoyl-CoA dioxygenase family)
MIYHKAGINSSTQPRYGINHMYTLPFLKQQINLPLVLKNKYSQDFPINRILGYHSREFSNVKDFRNYRYNKLINE